MLFVLVLIQFLSHKKISSSVDLLFQFLSITYLSRSVPAGRVYQSDFLCSTFVCSRVWWGRWCPNNLVGL